jgi:hypothetical protein
MLFVNRQKVELLPVFEIVKNLCNCLVQFRCVENLSRSAPFCLFLCLICCSTLQNAAVKLTITCFIQPKNLYYRLSRRKHNRMLIWAFACIFLADRVVPA